MSSTLGWKQPTRQNDRPLSSSPPGLMLGSSTIIGKFWTKMGSLRCSHMWSDYPPEPSSTRFSSSWIGFTWTGTVWDTRMLPYLCLSAMCIIPLKNPRGQIRIWLALKKRCLPPILDYENKCCLFRKSGNYIEKKGKKCLSPHSPAIGTVNILVKFGSVKIKVNKSNLICYGDRVLWVEERTMD